MLFVLNPVVIDFTFCTAGKISANKFNFLQMTNRHNRAVKTETVDAGFLSRTSCTVGVPNQLI